MKKMLQLVGGLLIASLPLSLNGQIINTNAPSQACQCDSITVTFSVGAQPANAGNQFRVELSDNTGVFSGNFIEFTPLTAFATGSYQIDAEIPCNTPQGAYSIRVSGSNPIQNGDTVTNIIVGKLPPVDSGITIEGAYFSNAFNDWRFCEGDSVILRAPAPAPGESFQYRWFEGGAQIPGQTGSGSDTLLVTQTGVYSLRLTLGLCQGFTDDFVINEYLPPSTITPQPGPGIQISPDTIRFCYGDTGVLSGPTPPTGVTYSYQWYSDSLNLVGNRVLYPLVGDTLQTLTVDTIMRIFLSVNDGFCEDTSSVFWVITDTTPVSPVQLVNWPPGANPTLSICENDSIMLSASDTVNGWNYQWEVFTVGSWTPIPGAENPWLQVNGEDLIDTTQFRLFISNQTCSWTSDTITVNWVPLPFVFTNITVDTIGLCPGDSVLVVAQGNSFTYEWSTGQTGSTIFISSPGTYVVEGFGPNGCSSTDTVHAVFFAPTADAGPDQTTNPDSIIQLDGSGGVSYYWSANKPVFFSDPRRANPFTIAAGKPDTVTYYLEIVGPNGCTDIDSMQVFVVPLPEDEIEPELWEVVDRVPNFISPNGDGINDELDLSEIMAGDICGLTVINRWGSEVYNTENYQNDWTGIDNGGSQLPDGAYVIILEHNNSVRYKGMVTIVRNNQ